jgi:hypothetical protein
METLVPIIDCVRVRDPEVLLIVVVWPIDMGPAQLLFPLSFERETVPLFRAKSSAPTWILLYKANLPEPLTMVPALVLPKEPAL